LGCSEQGRNGFQFRIGPGSLIRRVCWLDQRISPYAAYSRCIDETKPTAIPARSSQVTKAVVSERLKQSFKTELKSLESIHVEVELKEVGGAEGVFYHKLILTRNPGVEVLKIVSEGE
jgi:hypothetical protein